MSTVLTHTEHGRPPALRAARRRNIAMLAATLGTVVEYADWVIYATFASLFSPHFFPSSDPSTSLLSSFAVFAVGFVMRPIGGAVLGGYCDRHGRKKALTLSISLMAGASIAIALCPGYETIGIGASLLLVTARLVQGFSAGGEFGTGATFLVETGPQHRRGFSGSLQHMAVNAGVLVASLIGFTLSLWLAPAEMASWGWRVGFGVAGLLGLVVLWLRLAAPETAAFEALPAAEGRQRRPLTQMLRRHPSAAVRVIGIAMAGNLLNYLWLVHFPTYLHTETGLPLKDAFSASMISVAVSLVLIPAFGAWSDRIGRRRVLMLFAAGSALFAGPGLALLSANFWLDVLIVTVGMALVSLFSGAVAATMAEQFPADVRATGVSLPYAISVTLFGGTTPWVVTTLTHAGSGHLVWIYVAAICAISFAVYARMPESHRKALA
jgi:MHS family alpha-ketoglutarate permease-like MFS transporter